MARQSSTFFTVTTVLLLIVLIAAIAESKGHGCTKHRCKDSECCIKGACRPHMKLGQRCSPPLMLFIHRRVCMCGAGLYCAKVDEQKISRKAKYRCVPRPVLEDEEEAVVPMIHITGQDQD